jgi:hypothetical protein
VKRPKPLKPFHRYLVIPRQLAESELSTIPDAALRVYIYLLHRTVGFAKLSDSFKMDEICSGLKRYDGTPVDVGTGLSESAARRGLKWLAKSGWVTVKGSGKSPNSYSISKFLRVSPAEPLESAKGVTSDRSRVPLATPPSLQESIKKGECSEKVVSFPRRRG